MARLLDRSCLDAHFTKIKGQPMIKMFFNFIFFSTALLSCRFGFAADYLDIRPGGKYVLKSNVEVKVICMNIDDREIIETTSTIGPEHGAHMTVKTVEII